MPRHWQGTPANGCSECGQDFTSTQLFDAHRTGVYEYTLEQGLRLGPPREDGRRCLDRTPNSVRPGIADKWSTQG